VHFEIVGKIEDVEIIAVGGRIRDIMRLRRQFGDARWRKLKGIATVHLARAQCTQLSYIGILELRKISQVFPDQKAAKEGYLRIIDESGEDYLYPESYFIILELPREARVALTVAS
jgi:hypothetical protein